MPGGGAANTRFKVAVLLSFVALVSALVANKVRQGGTPPGLEVKARGKAATGRGAELADASPTGRGATRTPDRPDPGTMPALPSATPPEPVAEPESGPADDEPEGLAGPAGEGPPSPRDEVVPASGVATLGGRGDQEDSGMGLDEPAPLAGTPPEPIALNEPADGASPGASDPAAGAALPFAFTAPEPAPGGQEPPAPGGLDQPVAGGAPPEALAGGDAAPSMDLAGPGAAEDPGTDPVGTGQPAGVGLNPPAGVGAVDAAPRESPAAPTAGLGGTADPPAAPTPGGGLGGPGSARPDPRGFGATAAPDTEAPQAGTDLAGTDLAGADPAGTELASPAPSPDAMPGGMAPPGTSGPAPAARPTADGSAAPAYAAGAGAAASARLQPDRLRLQTVPDPADPPAAAPGGPAEPDATAGEVVGARIEPLTHVVRRGENFYTIARYYYGSGRYWRALWVANRDRVPRYDELYVGTTLRVPAPEELDRGLIDPPGPAGASARSGRVEGDGAGGPGRDAATRDLGAARTSLTSAPAAGDGVDLDLPEAPPAARAAAGEPDAAGRDRPAARRGHARAYTVRGAYETFRTIARDQLRDPSRADELYKLNADRADDPDAYLPPGTRLRLPEPDDLP
jgi:nucleoid-associated protein YgaU